MMLDILREFYEVNKKSIRVIVVLLIILIILKGVSIVFKNNSLKEFETISLSSSDNYDNIMFDSYVDYKNYIELNNIDSNLSEDDFDKNNYLFYYLESDYCEEVISLDSVDYKSSKIIINIDYYLDCDKINCDYNYILFVVPIKKGLYVDDPEIEVNATNSGDTELCESMPMLDKPILYMYPISDVDVTVKLEHPELLDTTYPKYIDGWNVHVKTNGDMYDEKGKYYYALYWDEYGSHNIDFSTGFYVTGDNALEFLEEKLNLIGLNDRERNEFIMYWLPKLEKNGKSLVYFELTDEREKYNKLYVSEKVDSLLRINMHIKKVSDYVPIKEEKLFGFERKGFVVVEWGGTIHN